MVLAPMMPRAAPARRAGCAWDVRERCIQAKRKRRTSARRAGFARFPPPPPPTRQVLPGRWNTGRHVSPDARIR